TMARPRRAGARPVASTPSIRMVPELTSSRPAMSRSRVDLPQPEGPTKTTNSPSAISRSTPGITFTPLNSLVTRSRVIAPSLLPLFDRADGEAADLLLLAEPAHDQNRRDGHGRRRRELGPEESLRAGVRRDEGGQRRRAGGGEVQRPERLVPRQDNVQQQGRGDTRHRHRRQHVDDLLAERGAVHARRLQDLAGD